eukprot:gene7893-10676_t
MKITTKGQVTIPQDLREEFGLLPNTDVEFVRDGKGGVRLVKSTKAGTRGTDLVAALRGDGADPRRIVSTLVDSNVLIDVLSEDERWFEWSAQALAHGGDPASVVELLPLAADIREAWIANVTGE